MNVFAAESGSWAKPLAACCAATKALHVLMLKDLLKSVTWSERGSSGGLGVTALPSQTQLDKPPRFRAAIHTIVNDNTWDTQRCLDLGECIDNSDGIREITLDVDLVGSVVGLGRFPRRQSNLVAFRRKYFSYSRANSGPGAENEDDGECGGHGASCGRRK